MQLILSLLWATSVVMADTNVLTPDIGLKPSARNLHIRSIPAVLGVSSNVYEIYMPPFSYHDGRPLIANVEVTSQGPDGNKAVRGELMLMQHQPPTGPVLITGNITGLAKGHHGFHVHEFGDLRKGCASAGPHFNPYMQPHGGPIDPFRHVGDLGNIAVGDDGIARVEIWDHMISLTGSNSILGRSIVIHEMKDDYGRGGDMESVKTGNAGARLACGVIGYCEDPYMGPPPPPPPPMMGPWHHHNDWDSYGPPPMGPWPGRPPGGPGGYGPGHVVSGQGHMEAGKGQMEAGQGQMGSGSGQMAPAPVQKEPEPSSESVPPAEGPESEPEANS